MTFSGQCPVCRDTIALSEASLNAAPVAGPFPESDAPTVECECGSVLIAVDLSQVNEITAECRACSSKYVVDRSGAGEELPCRCGAEVTVPTAILIEAMAGRQYTSDVDTSGSPEHESSISSFADIEIEAIDDHAVASDMEQESAAAQFADVEIEAIDDPIDDAESDGDLIDDHAVASDMEQESEATQLANVEIEAIDDPIDDAESDEDLIDDHAVASDLEGGSEAAQLANVEIEAIDDLIDDTETDGDLIDDHAVASDMEEESVAAQRADVDVEGIDECEDIENFAMSENRISLPIVALPIVVQIQLPSAPDETIAGERTAGAEERLASHAKVLANERRRNVRLPIVAIPDVYVIPAPAAPVSSAPFAPAPAPEPQTIPESQIQSPVGDALAPESAVPTDDVDHDRREEESHRSEQIAAVSDQDVIASPAQGIPGAESSTKVLHGSGQAAPSMDATTVACPGCQREYPVMKSEMGQTAECTCGFVFVMKENISALDSAFCADLMPVVPLAVDRTGDKLRSDFAHYQSSSPAFARRSAAGNQVDHRQRQAIVRILVAAAAVFLVVSITIGVAVKNRGGGVARTEIKTNPRDMLAVPILVSPTDADAMSAVVGNAAAETGDIVQVEDAADVQHAAVSSPVGPAEAIAFDSTAGPKDKPGDSVSSFLAPLQALARELESEQVLGREPLFRFGEMQTKLDLTGVQFSVPDLFWLGNLWEGFGLRAENPELASKCYWLAASAFGLAQTLESISPSDRDLAMQRQRELSAKSLSAVRLADRMNGESLENASR